MAQMIAARPAHTSTSAQILLELDHPSANTDLAFRLGWDHAHYGLTPPAEHLFDAAALRQGWLAGRASYGGRTLKASRHVRLWLELRMHAWLRGRAFEEVQLTPNYLQQIDTEWCPIRRVALDQGVDAANRRSIDRVRDNAAYAAGNLVMMSRAANTAKQQHDWQSSVELVRSLAQRPFEPVAGLQSNEWQRIATLCSFVTELPHEQAAALPMLVLPPNRLRLFNPIQALQAVISRQLLMPGWSQRLNSVEALLPSAALKRDLNTFALSLVPRLLQAGQQSQGQSLRWALEDAWGTELVQRRWAQFAHRLTPDQAEQLVTRVAATSPSPLRIQRLESDCATEGWALELGGLQPATPGSRPTDRVSNPRRRLPRSSVLCH